MKMQIILVILSVIEIATCARILCVFPTPFYSHQSVFQPIWRELSLRGHEVTVITTNPIKNASLTTLREIDLSFTYKLTYEDHQMQYVINTESNLVILMKHLFFVIHNMTIEQLHHPEVQKLIKSEDKFDLLILEPYILAWFGFAQKYRCPVVMLTSMDAANHFKLMMGNLYNPVLTHHYNLPYVKEVTFWQRLVCVASETLDLIQFNFFTLPTQQKLIREALDDQEIDIAATQKNVSLLLMNIIPGFDKVTTHLPSVIKLTGLQIREPQPLPQELQQFLDEAPTGVVYFSLGSTIKSYLITKEKQKLFLDAFSELPYKVIWKFEDGVEDLPRNVKLLKWAPQQDILRHKNTKLFITQGGLQSIDEGIRFNVPVLVLPFFGDHFFNGMRMEHLNLGSWLDFKTMTKESFKMKVLETFDNGTYRENLEEISSLLHQPPNSLDKAIWWIEYVLRHKGAYHLRSPLADIPFYQYYLLDVIVFLLVLVMTLLFALVGLSRILWKLRQKPFVNKLKMQ